MCVFNVDISALSLILNRTSSFSNVMEFGSSSSGSMDVRFGFVLFLINLNIDLAFDNAEKLIELLV